jgi:hypothetical protein
MCLGRLFNSKLGRITILLQKVHGIHTATSIVENSSQV